MAGISLAALADEYVADGLVAGNVLGVDDVQRELIKATRFYLGFSTLTETKVGGDPLEIGDITALTTLTASEWVLIAKLFRLYAELKNQTILEASRMVTGEMYGRAVSEVQADITAMHETLPKDIFNCDAFSVDTDGFGDSTRVELNNVTLGSGIFFYF